MNYMISESFIYYPDGFCDSIMEGKDEEKTAYVRLQLFLVTDSGETPNTPWLLLGC